MDRATVRKEVIALLAQIQKELPKLQLADVTAIMDTHPEVADLLHGNLDISNVTGFKKAVACLLKEIQSHTTKRTQI